MDLSRAGVKRFLDLNELEEIQNDAYLNSKIAKERSKKWHDQMINGKNFNKGTKSSYMIPNSIYFQASSSRDGRVHS